MSRPSFTPAPPPEMEVQRERKPRKTQREDAVRAGRLEPYKRSSRQSIFSEFEDEDDYEA
jgi:hypothetical protein